jgi:MFS family permease
VLWSVVAFVVEVPSGAWADTWSRRRLYALGEFLTAAGFATWTFWPTYTGFALGFVLWGLGGSLGSGTLEALVYDELAATGSTEKYARVIGRAGTVAILAQLAATMLAAPVFAWGGYTLVGVLSVAVVATGGVIAWGLPETPRQESADEFGGVRGYLATLRSGLREVRGSRTVFWAVAIAALVPGFTALDEYLPLLSRAAGASTVSVPLLFALPSLAMAVGSALAGRWSTIGPPRLGLAFAAAAVLLSAGALLCAWLPLSSAALIGMVPIAVAFGVLQFAIVITETRLQDSIGSGSRATVLSVAGFASETFAVLLYAYFGLGAEAVSVPVLVAGCGLPLLATAVAIRLRLRAPEPVG